MKIALVGPASSVHLTRWANGLSQRGLDVHLFTLHGPDPALLPAVKVYRLRGRTPLAYVTAAAQLRRHLVALAPDLVNAHYASGYGLLARLSRCRPLMMSVWGSDIYRFPNNLLKRYVLRANLKFATAIGSTSRSMAKELSKFITGRDVMITPFGIDEERFRSEPRDAFSADLIVIGTAKTLELIYGIDTLIEAFALLKEGLAPDVARRLRLVIAGVGHERAKLERLSERLGIRGVTEFRGWVPQRHMSRCLSDMDIFVALSRYESFGVTTLEAGACERPVVVSDADGPREITVDGVTGFIVPRDNPAAAAEKIKQLVLDPELRARMGRAGRVHVVENYAWARSLDLMLNAYDHTLRLYKQAQGVDWNPGLADGDQVFSDRG